MTTQVHTMRAAKQMDQAAVAAATADAATKQAEAAVAMVEAERQRGLMQLELREREAATRTAEQAQKLRETEAKRKAANAEKARKKAEAKKARAELLKAASARRAMMLTLIVVAASMTIAWPGQAIFLSEHGMAGFGLIAPIVIEGPQWLAAVLEGEAVKHEGKVWHYRLATFAFSLVAASLNYAHGSESGRIIGAVFALASMVGVVVWEMYVHSQRPAHTKRTAAERKRAMQRRLSYPRIYRRAVRLARATGMEMESAWPMAWREVHGTDVGVTAKGLRKQGEAMAEIGEALKTHRFTTLPGAQLTSKYMIESAAKWAREAAAAKALPAATASPAPAPTGQGVKGARKGSEKASAKAPKPQAVPPIPPANSKLVRAPKLPLHQAAKQAAKETATKAQQDPAVAAQERIQAAQMYASSQGTAEPLSYAKVGAKFGRSDEWVRLAVKEHGGLHAVPDAA